MTLADTMAKALLQANALTGVAATLVDPRGAYATSGAVTETPVEYAVSATTLREEVERSQGAGITAIVHVTNLTAGVRPKPGWRLKHGGRLFAVTAVTPNNVGSTVIEWRLEVGEVA